MKRAQLTKSLILLSVFSLCISAGNVCASVSSDGASFNPPPRDIKDILLVLDQTEPDKELQAKANKYLATPMPVTEDKVELNNYFYHRARAFEVMSDEKASLASIKEVLEKYPNPEFYADDLLFAASLESNRGNIKAAQAYIEIAENSTNYGWLLNAIRLKGMNCLKLGDITCAKSALDKIDGLRSGMRTNSSLARMQWDGRYYSLQGNILLSEGKYSAAEIPLTKAFSNSKTIFEANNWRGLNVLDYDKRVTESVVTASDGPAKQMISLQLDIAKAKLGQKRYVDAELQARDALGWAIKRTGPNSIYATQCLLSLSQIIAEQGRTAEAVLLSRRALQSVTDSGAPPSSLAYAEIRKSLASALVADHKYVEADKVFTEMAEAINADPTVASRYPAQDLDWVLALVKIGKAQSAVTMSSQILDREQKYLDKNSSRLAMDRAFNATALQALGESVQAQMEFKTSVPALIAQARNDAENATESLRQTQRMNFVLEGYLGSLVQLAKSDSSGQAADEAFQVADLARGSGVQRALAASAARANISNPQLSALARREQDLELRINSLSSVLTNLLSAPSDQQLPSVQTKIRADITAYKSEREDLKQEIERKFPEYAELVSPKPANVKAVQKVLTSDEVLVSWYFGDKVSYVWAITRDKPAAFAQIAVGRGQIAKEVTELRMALDPNVAHIEEIPQFDIALANHLYNQILAPVAGSFQDRKLMIVAPHGELAQLPLSLLTTKPSPNISQQNGILFSGYRSAPWLARDIAIEQVPSVTALVVLRNAPQSSANRKSFIGFGDPYFSLAQAQSGALEVAASIGAARGGPARFRSTPTKLRSVSSADLALLPRLADTALEINEVARVMNASSDDIYLHERASVKQVTTMDLSNRKIIMFSTHGLIPGDLNGLTQPALAMSSPAVTGDSDDGLLTMDKVISLKLDADWVVLSACNTAAGDGGGAEAFSGLGKAFFFAGAKALLVSNWPVDSDAARVMMSDLFKSYQKTTNVDASNPNRQRYGKAQALRQSMLDLIDSGGAKEGEKMKYAYAHPIFWSPFVVVGD